MARGRTKGRYITSGRTGEPAGFTVQVPDNLFAIGALGWGAHAPGETTMPKNFHPRHVVGVDAAGHRVRVMVPDVTADLWTGATNTWEFIDNFGATQTATATGVVGEAFTL